MYPSKKQFIKLARRGNIIPVYRSIPIGKHIPVEVFNAVDEGGFSFLLESMKGPEKIARYSFIGTSPKFVFKSFGRRVFVLSGSRAKSFKARRDPLSEIEKMMSKYRFVEVQGLPRFCGGLVGYMGYDMVRFFERLPDKNKDDLETPDSVLMLAEDMIIFDHKEGLIKAVSNAHISGSAGVAYDRSHRKIDRMIGNIKISGPSNVRRKALKKNKKLSLKSNMTRAEFIKGVKRAKAYIKRGDIIQTVLSQRFEAALDAPALDVYNALRRINPSPYMYYLKLGDIKLIGSSPEIMVRCENGKVEVRPIAGTRRRGDTASEERALEKELLADPKERAEHIMLVDLGRNDIGRVCEKGSVHIPEFMTIEKYSHVMHIVSDCVGKLSKDKNNYDVIRATFPAGTVTGAPKIRAMEIIDELENRRRGPYAGCIGYFSFSGNLDTCITIRTILVKDGKAYIQAGAGIVADSSPEREYA
ncbi:MAG: anthranilate synthase component I, partial [Candidatus Omnitrophica bacterium CG1_02_49_10]